MCLLLRHLQGSLKQLSKQVLIFSSFWGEHWVQGYGVSWAGRCCLPEWGFWICFELRETMWPTPRVRERARKSSVWFNINVIPRLTGTMAVGKNGFLTCSEFAFPWCFSCHLEGCKEPETGCCAIRKGLLNADLNMHVAWSVCNWHLLRRKRI